MLVVVVDTSTPAVTAALLRVTPGGVELLAERRTVDARAHGERLAPAVEAVLAEGGVGPDALAAIVAGLGPGPFTGLRVGLVTAAALGQALGVPTYGVCSLDGIGAATDDAVLVATDARRKEIYWAAYEGGERMLGPAVNRAADVPDLLRAAGIEVGAVVGDAAGQLAGVLPVRELPRYPEARVLARLAAPRIRSGAPGEALTPLYLRRPDAVEPTTRKPALPSVARSGRVA